MKFFFSVILLSTVSLFFAQSQIGHTTITFNDPARTGGFGSGGGTGRQIQTEIYYPSTTAGTMWQLPQVNFPLSLSVMVLRWRGMLTRIFGSITLTVDIF